MAAPGLKQVFALPHRTDVMLNEQLCLVQDAQANLEKALGSLERADTEEDVASHMAQVQALKTRTDELLIMLQLLVKIRTELAHCMRDVEKARHEGKDTKPLRKRVGWLEDRLEKLLLSRRKARRTHTRQALETRRLPLLDARRTNRVMPGIIVMPPGDSESVPLSQEVTGGSGPILHQCRDTHINGRLDVVDEASISQQSGSLSAGGLEVSGSSIGSSIGSAVTSESSWVTESGDETDSSLDSESEEDSSTLQESVTEVSQSTGMLDQENSTSQLVESTSLIDHVFQSQVSVAASNKSDENETRLDAKETDDLATISQAWSVRTDTLPVTHKSIANYGALLTSRESRTGRYPQFMTQKVAAESESSSQPLPEPHVRSPPRPMRRPPTIHTQYEFIEGCEIDDPLSWHRLGLAVESSFIPSRTKRTPIPWRARTVHSVLGSTATNEKMELEHSGFERLSQKIDKLFSLVELTADDLAGHRMPEIRKGSRSRSSTPSRHGSARYGKRIPNSVQASVYASIPELEIPAASEPFHRAVTDRSRCYPADLSQWTGGVSPTAVCVKRVAAQSRQTDTRLDIQYKTPSREGRSSSMSVWKKAAKGISVVSRLQRSFAVKPKDIYGQKAKCIEHLLNHQLQSTNAADRRKAVKSLGHLQWKDKAVLNGLRDRIRNDCDELVQMEASRAMLSLGIWEDCAVKVIFSALRTGTKELQIELLSAISVSKNVKLIDKEKVQSFSELVSVIKSLLMATDSELAFSAALCLGEMCVYDPMAKQVLLRKLDDPSYGARASALEILVRQMNCSNDYVIDTLLSQLKNSFSSKDRRAAAELLGQLSMDSLSQHHSVEVLSLLERKLWDDGVKDVRKAAADALRSLGKSSEKRQTVIKRLEDSDDHIRAQAATSLGMLGVRDGQHLRLLLDLIELDPSVYVRIQAVRSVASQGIANSRVLRLLKEREKGDGPLAREAAKALRQLKQFV